MMKKLFAAAFAAIALASCSDEPKFISTDPSVDSAGKYAVSSFSIENRHYSIPAGTDSVNVALISSDGATLVYGAAVETGAEAARFHMYIPDHTPLADGRYVMTLATPEGAGIGGRLMADFADSRLKNVAFTLPAYMLDGEGTADSPYIISDDDSFNMFIINLTEDEANGAGLYFRQTADVVPSDQSSYAPGRGYWGAPFAGDYDGGGHAVTGLYYKGSGREDSDTGFGFFTELRGHASVRNVAFKAVSVSGIRGRSGIVAATATGSHVLSGISLSGHFEGVSGGSEIGGLVGYVASGSVAVSDVDFGLDISGYNEVGGLFGKTADGTSVTVSKLTTSNLHFSVAGNNNVGGIVGYASGAVSVDNARFDHKVSAEDADIRIISASGSGVGAVAGYIGKAGGNMSMRNVRILCPVGGKNAWEVGGMIGKLCHTGTLTLNSCRVYSVVEGNRTVGGLFGNADFSGTVVVEGTDDDTRVVVDDMAASVSGSEKVGGIAGYWHGRYSPKARVRVNLPVKGSSLDTGGAFGHVVSTDFNVSNFRIGDASDAAGGDPVMRVTGGRNTGGFAGYMEKGSLRGPDKFDYATGHGIAVPDKSRFKPAYSSVVQGSESVGGLIGAAVAMPMSAVSANGTVTGSVNVGGLVGYFEEKEDKAHIEDCAFLGIVKADNSNYVGGIVGQFKSCAGGRMQDCVNYADISGHNCTGGIVGYIDKDRPKDNPGYSRTLNVAWCVNVGAIRGGGDVGGIVGFTNSRKTDSEFSDDYESDVTIRDSMNRGTVHGSGSDGGGGVGGILGRSEQRTFVYRCANHGAVSASAKLMGLGGIAGRAGRDASGFGLFNMWLNMHIEECVNRGEVSCDNGDTRVGGILGYQEEGENCAIYNCLNSGPVTSDQKHDNGGIVGYIDHLAKCNECVNSGKVSYGNAIVGDHKADFDAYHDYFLSGSGKHWPSQTHEVSSSNFKKQSSFPDLDFNKYWTMGSDGPEPKNCQWR